MTRVPQHYTTQQSRCSAPSSAIYILSLAVSFLFGVVTADCECGYSTSIDGASHVFTDLIETDFTKVQDIADDTDWRRQAFNVTSERARGQFGEMFNVDNVAPGGSSMDGLELTVTGTNVEGMVPVAEIDSDRADLLWGTFRASMKLTSTPGTCAAFFWVSDSVPGRPDG